MSNKIISHLGELFLLIIAIAIVFAFGYFLPSEFEEENCDRLVRQSKEGLIGFYITQEDNQACLDRGIIINAPIK
jgi:hypothetical protein